MQTYGAELELADIDQTRELPAGYGWDRRDYSMVNSNGIAVDPKGISYKVGGEICMKPANSTTELANGFVMIKEMFPEMKVNYRSNLHVHVRLPGLSEDLPGLKKLQEFTHRVFRPFIKELEPIPAPEAGHYESLEAFNGAQWRYRRRRKSHQTFLTMSRLEHQLEAQTVQEFMEREVPLSKAGQVMWHAQSRCCVNIRQLRETDTIEFRHFPGTIHADEFQSAVEWVKRYMELFQKDCTMNEMRDAVHDFAPHLPRFERYCHWQELRYKRTCHDGTVPRHEREAAIKEILAEDSKQP